jgi:hypothetical protein
MDAFPWSTWTAGTGGPGRRGEIAANPGWPPEGAPGLSPPVPTRTRAGGPVLADGELGASNGVRPPTRVAVASLCLPGHSRGPSPRVDSTPSESGSGRFDAGGRMAMAEAESSTSGSHAVSPRSEGIVLSALDSGSGRSGSRQAKTLSCRRTRHRCLALHRSAGRAENNHRDGNAVGACGTASTSHPFRAMAKVFGSWPARGSGSLHTSHDLWRPQRSAEGGVSGTAPGACRMGGPLAANRSPHAPR